MSEIITLSNRNISDILMPDLKELIKLHKDNIPFNFKAKSFTLESVERDFQSVEFKFSGDKVFFDGVKVEEFQISIGYNCLNFYITVKNNSGKEIINRTGYSIIGDGRMYNLTSRLIKLVKAFSGNEDSYEINVSLLSQIIRLDNTDIENEIFNIIKQRLGKV